MQIDKTLWYQNTKAPSVKSGRYLLGVLAIVMPLMAHAQLELYGKFNSGGSVEPIINYYGSKKISKKMAITFFGLVRRQWSQALIGVSYQPAPGIILSASGGIEQGQQVPRCSAGIWMKRRRNSFLLLGELGSGYKNYLYKVNVFHQFSEQVSLGIMDWRYHGLGPNFRYTAPSISSTLLIMPAYDHEQKVTRCMIGYSFHM